MANNNNFKQISVSFEIDLVTFGQNNITSVNSSDQELTELLDKKNISLDIIVKCYESFLLNYISALYKVTFSFYIR